jgi:hypothetical protein
MSVAADLYLSVDKTNNFGDVFSESGFAVTASARTLADGSRTSVYACERDSGRVSITVLPLSKDSSNVELLLLAKPRHSKTLESAMALLQEWGALTPDQYHPTRSI